MSFIKNLGEKLGTAAGNAADKARQMAEISKLNTAITTTERSISDVLLEIGKKVLEEEKNNPESRFAPQIATILKAEDTIADLKDKIAQLKAEDKQE